MTHFNLYREGRPAQFISYCGLRLSSQVDLTQQWSKVTCEQCHTEHAKYLQGQHEAMIEHDSWREEKGLFG